MEMIKVGEVKLNFQEKGAGPTVILIHGVPTDYRAWGGQFGALSQHYRTIAYSRRCAFPNKNSDFTDSTVENNEKDLEGLIDHLGGGPVHLIGHSYGGAVAANYALRQPALVRSLVLIEPYLPTMLLRDPDSVAQRLSLLFRKPSVAIPWRKAMKNNQAMLKELDQKNNEKVLQMFLDGLEDRQDAMKQYSASAIAMMRSNIATVAELRTKSPQFSKVEARNITQPTLLLTGERSIKVQHAIVGELHRTIPNNQMVTIRNAAHFSFMENPTEFNEVVLKFMTEHASSSETQH
ncbi:MAG: alpha/beta hydrolase [Methanomassiliicoccales archaeon]|jgi:pimeloyl-ACP methyl ester carboxylesterase